MLQIWATIYCACTGPRPQEHSTEKKSMGRLTSKKSVSKHPQFRGTGAFFISTMAHTLIGSYHTFHSRSQRGTTVRGNEGISAISDYRKADSSMTGSTDEVKNSQTSLSKRWVRTEVKASMAIHPVRPSQNSTSKCGTGERSSN